MVRAASAGTLESLKTAGDEGPIRSPH